MQLPAPLVSLGRMLGVLVDGDGDDAELDDSWFRDPSSSLRTIGTRLRHLVELLADALPPPATNGPPVFANASWRPLPDPRDGSPTWACIVTGPSSATTGELGVGFLDAMSDGGTTTAEISAYVPLVDYGPAGATFVLGSAAAPLRVGVRAASVAAAGFRVGAVSFTAISLELDIPVTSAAAPSFVLQIEGLAGTTKPSRYTRLAELVDIDLANWIGTAAASCGWLQAQVGDTWMSFRTLFVGAGLLTVDDDGTIAFDIGDLLAITPDELPIRLLLGALRAGAGDGFSTSLVGLRGGGLYVDGDGLRYGLRLALEYPILASPAVALCLGRWLSGEDDTANWQLRSGGSTLGLAGIAFDLVEYDKVDRTPRFAPSVRLESVGFDVAGVNGAPLFSVGGTSVSGIELRGSYDSADGSFGAAIRVDDLAFPLGPGFGNASASAADNPAAQGLLAAGGSGDSSTAAAAGQRQPAAPGFSAALGWLSGGRLAAQLFDANDQPATLVKLPVERAFGPIHVTSLGVGWDDTRRRLELALDGGVTLAGLEVDLDQLSVAVPITSPTDLSSYALDLAGLDLSISAGPVTVGAAFVKLAADPQASPPRPWPEYDGTAFVTAGSFALTALGSYAYARDATGAGYASLFLFGVLDVALGGPPCFVVTGIAAGFGWNRRLVLPDMAAVTTFPLVAAATDPTAMGATPLPDGGFTPPAPAAALARLDAFVPPERGEMWLAGGVRFTSFDLIHATALLVVELGRDVEIALLGQAWISLPPPAAPGGVAPAERYAYAELGILVKLVPAQGLLAATAVLTPRSFVFAPECKLTGGFAMYAWFGANPLAGQFVLTLGGYHPAFHPPSAYPQVPRLAIAWPVASGVAISGDAYFALTPSAVMAGGALSATYAEGPLRAWFSARMDALITWSPFHYLIDVSVSIGASYRVSVLGIQKTLSAELGGVLHLWGPPTGGRVKVSWYVISFSVAFGAPASPALPPLAWTDAAGQGFAQTLLPAAPVTITAAAGLIGTYVDGGDTVWVVRPSRFAVSVTSAAPASALVIGSSTTAGAPAVHVRPMKATLASSVITVDLGGASDGFDVAPARVAAPAAKWGAPLPAGADPEPNALVAQALVGIDRAQPKAPALSPSGDATLAVSLEDALQPQPVGPRIAVPITAGAAPPLAPPVALADELARVQATVTLPATAATRTRVAALVQLWTGAARADGSLAAFAADPLASLGATPLATSAA